MFCADLQGGPDEPGVADDEPFFLGLVGFVVLAAATGAYLRRDRTAAARVVGAALGILVVGTALSPVQLALTRLPGNAWWQPELAFVVAALMALVVVCTVAAPARRATHDVSR